MRPKAPPVCSPVAFTITRVPKNHTASDLGVFRLEGEQAL
jgi:hypothetical protein